MSAEPAPGAPVGAATDRVAGGRPSTIRARSVATSRPASAGPTGSTSWPSARTTGCTSSPASPAASGPAGPSWTVTAGSSSARRPPSCPGRPVGWRSSAGGWTATSGSTCCPARRATGGPGGSRSSTPGPIVGNVTVCAPGPTTSSCSPSASTRRCGPSAGSTTRAGPGGAGSMPGPSGTSPRRRSCAVNRAASRCSAGAPTGTCGRRHRPTGSAPTGGRRGCGSPIRPRSAGTSPPAPSVPTTSQLFTVGTDHRMYGQRWLDDGGWSGLAGAGRRWPVRRRRHAERGVAPGPVRWSCSVPIATGTSATT